MLFLERRENTFPTPSQTVFISVFYVDMPYECDNAFPNLKMCSRTYFTVEKSTDNSSKIELCIRFYDQCILDRHVSYIYRLSSRAPYTGDDMVAIALIKNICFLSHICVTVAVAETWRRVWGGRKFFSQTKISE